jgi:uncharacterized protein YjiS (DUF1127 family)
VSSTPVDGDRSWTTTAIVRRTIAAAVRSASGELSAAATGRQLLGDALGVLEVWRRRHRYRRELDRLLRTGGRHLIEDIGLSRQRAEGEVAKPFWRL